MNRFNPDHHLRLLALTLFFQSLSTGIQLVAGHKAERPMYLAGAMVFLVGATLAVGVHAVALYVSPGVGGLRTKGADKLSDIVSDEQNSSVLNCPINGQSFNLESDVSQGQGFGSLNYSSTTSEGGVDSSHDRWLSSEGTVREANYSQLSGSLASTGSRELIDLNMADYQPTVTYLFIDYILLKMMSCLCLPKVDSAAEAERRPIVKESMDGLKLKDCAEIKDHMGVACLLAMIGSAAANAGVLFTLYAVITTMQLDAVDTKSLVKFNLAANIGGVVISLLFSRTCLRHIKTVGELFDAYDKKPVSALSKRAIF